MSEMEVNPSSPEKSPREPVSGLFSRFSTMNNSPSLPTGHILSPSMQMTSERLSAGMITSVSPAFFANAHIEKIPDTGFTNPSSDNSPISANPPSFSASICPPADNIPAAIARSNPVPSFLMSDGARFTVILPFGSSNPQFFIAAQTLFLDSLTDAPASPIMLNSLSPGVTKVSTVVIIPVTPLMHTVSITVIIPSPPQ